MAGRSLRRRSPVIASSLEDSARLRLRGLRATILGLWGHKVMDKFRESSGKETGASMPEPAIVFGTFRFTPRTGELWRGLDEVKLTPRAAAVLAILAERPQQVVTKDELLAHAWNGKAVGDEALTSCIQELRHALGDDARQPRFIETWHRRGYKLIVPAASTLVESSAPDVTPSLSLPDKPSIAVLPFRNVSGDIEQEYFADGIVLDIIAALSRFHSLFVIAQSSSSIYKGRAVDVKQIGRELGVRYVLGGSVRKAANRLRVTAQLVDAATGSHLWADRLEGALEAVFEFQDQITEKVVSIVAPRIMEAEIARAKRKPSGNLDAYDCHLRGMALFQPLTRQGVVEALRLFGRAMELDPDYPAPYGRALGCYVIRRAYGWVDDPEKDKQEVTRLVQTAVRVGRDDARTLSHTAHAVAYVLGNLPLAKGLIDQALLLNTNVELVWGTGGWINLWLGHPDIAVEHFRRALRHDPHYTRFNRGMREAMAHACFFLGRYEEAVSWAERELQGDPDTHVALRIGAASAACAGNIDVAQRLGRHLLSVDPTFRVSRLARDYLGPYQKPEFVTMYAEGLRKAGLPE
jgi:TolB-like protein